MATIAPIPAAMAPGRNIASTELSSFSAALNDPEPQYGTSIPMTIAAAPARAIHPSSGAGCEPAAGSRTGADGVGVAVAAARGCTGLLTGAVGLAAAMTGEVVGAAIAGSGAGSATSAAGASAASRQWSVQADPSHQRRRVAPLCVGAFVPARCWHVTHVVSPRVS